MEMFIDSMQHTNYCCNRLAILFGGGFVISHTHKDLLEMPMLTRCMHFDLSLHVHSY